MSTTVRERPIIMSAESVRAILAGRKTQTRRVVKPQPAACIHCGRDRMWYLDGLDGLSSTCECARYQTPWDGEPKGLHRNAGWLNPDETYRRLWVRETWAQPYERTDKNPGTIYLADGPDFLSPAARLHNWGRDVKGVWRSPIHMPRWASRLTLEITDVRVERVQDISEADALAEGVAGAWLPAGELPGWAHPDGTNYTGPSMAFRDGWNTLNAKRGAGWDANPWVWCITFRIMDPAGASPDGAG